MPYTCETKKKRVQTRRMCRERHLLHVTRRKEKLEVMYNTPPHWYEKYFKQSESLKAGKFKNCRLDHFAAVRTQWPAVRTPHKTRVSQMYEISWPPYCHVCKDIHTPWRYLRIYIYGLQIITVKWSRYRPGVAQRVGRGIALLFHDHRTRRGEWPAARSGRTLPLGKSRYPLYRRLGGPQGRSERAENLVPTGIRSRTVQHVVSRYTDWATGPTLQMILTQN
jgi:hypothetical protein